MVTIVVQVAGGVCTSVTLRPSEQTEVVVVDWDDILDDVERRPVLPEGVSYTLEFGRLAWEDGWNWEHA